MNLKISYAYVCISTLCRIQSEVTLNYIVYLIILVIARKKEEKTGIGRIRNRLKLSGGQGY
jgi:hypothetical protein